MSAGHDRRRAQAKTRAIVVHHLEDATADGVHRESVTEGVGADEGDPLATPGATRNPSLFIEPPRHEAPLDADSNQRTIDEHPILSTNLRARSVMSR
jgi:hypothetical protein